MAAAYPGAKLPNAENVRQHARRAASSLLLTDAALLFSPAQLALAALCLGLQKVHPVGPAPGQAGYSQVAPHRMQHCLSETGKHATDEGS